MNRFRSSIATFIAFLLSGGLLISTLHTHELLNSHAHVPVDTIHVLGQAHDTCPFCAVVFEGVLDAGISGALILNCDDNSPVVTDQVDFIPVFSDKDGRSPPSFG